MVQTFERDGTLAVNVGERFVATCQRDPDTGDLVVVDRLAELLTDAPEPYFCGRCGGEKAPEAEMCASCDAAETAFRRGRWSAPS
ncbi:MAG TPA: hypothetical protein VFJ82_01565 [Longimicrobium sp.]|nr:hypothetical protein [Longimicrobium sp.]